MRAAFFRSGRLAGGVEILVLFMGSTLLTPLYDLYRERYALDSIQITSIYAVYVVGNLAALLFLGRLSDRLGRKPVALIGLLLATISTLAFLGGRPLWLYAARAMSGCAVGVGSGAATAWISESLPEERRAQAATMMTAFNFAGLTLGPPVGGLLAEYTGHPLWWPFVAYLVLIGTTGLLVWRAVETGSRGSVTLADFRPRLGVPPRLRPAFAAPAIAGFVAMSVVGYYAALGPTIVMATLSITNRAIGGLAVAELFAVATVVILLARTVEPARAMLYGLVAVPFGLAALVAGQHWPSIWLMLLATTLCGSAAALSYRGGLGMVNAIAPADRRAELASSYFICCFLGNALPVIGVGILTEELGQRSASHFFALALTALAVAAVAATRRRGGRRHVARSPTSRRPSRPRD